MPTRLFCAASELPEEAGVETGFVGSLPLRAWFLNVLNSSVKDQL